MVVSDNEAQELDSNAMLKVAGRIAMSNGHYIAQGKPCRAASLESFTAATRECLNGHLLPATGIRMPARFS